MKYNRNILILFLVLMLGFQQGWGQNGIVLKDGDKTGARITKIEPHIRSKKNTANEFDFSETEIKDRDKSVRLGFSGVTLNEGYELHIEISGTNLRLEKNIHKITSPVQGARFTLFFSPVNDGRATAKLHFKLLKTNNRNKKFKLEKEEFKNIHWRFKGTKIDPAQVRAENLAMQKAAEEEARKKELAANSQAQQTNSQTNSKNTRPSNSTTTKRKTPTRKTGSSRNRPKGRTSTQTKKDPPAAPVTNDSKLTDKVAGDNIDDEKDEREEKDDELLANTEQTQGGEDTDSEDDITPTNDSSHDNLLSGPTLWLVIAGFAFMLFVIVNLFLRLKKKEEEDNNSSLDRANTSSDKAPIIILNKKTMPLEDGRDLVRPTYYEGPLGYTFNLEDIWPDTAVKEVLISNTCARELSNFVQKGNLALIDKDQEVPEIGGFLLGTPQKINEEQYSVVLNEFVEVEPEAHGVYKIEFGTKAFAKLDEINEDEAYQNMEILAWFHTHPGHGLFLSKPDLKIQEGFFREKFQLAVEIDSLTDDLDIAFFSWSKSREINNTDKRKAGMAWYQWKDIQDKEADEFEVHEESEEAGASIAADTVSDLEDNNTEGIDEKDIKLTKKEGEANKETIEEVSAPVGATKTKTSNPKSKQKDADQKEA